MQNETQTMKPTASEPTTGWGSVLVVDDEQQNRTLLRDPLEAFGYRVEEAENGMEALQKIAAHPPERDPARPDDAKNGRLRSLPSIKGKFQDNAYPDSDGNCSIRTRRPTDGHSCRGKRLFK